MSTRQRVRVVSVTLLVLLFTSLVAPSASAATLPQTFTADPPIVTPPNGGPKAYILNILGSVLKGAMPNSWRAEQLALNSRYNHGFETLEAQFGTNPANPNYSGAPDSYQDYVIKKHEQEIGKPFKAPVTKTQSFVKTVGGAATALTGFAMGTAAGAFALELFGIDGAGAVCGSAGGGPLLGLVTGQDCDAWQMTQDAIDQANSDASGGVVAGISCGFYLANEVCFELKAAPVVDFGQNLYCMAVTDIGANGKVYGRLDVRDRLSDEFVGIEGEQPVGNTGNFNAANDRCQRAFPGETVFGYITYVPGREDATYLNSYRAGLAGNVIVPQEASADPERTLVCSITGTDGVTYTQESEPYHETDGEIAAPECPVLPEGVGVAGVSVEDSEGNELFAPDMNEDYQDWWAAYPECRTGACKLDLVKTANTEFPVSCFDLMYECDGWFESPSKADNFECHYGIHTVDLSECNAYSGTFDPQRLQVGAPYSDPLTGTWSGGANAPAPDKQALAQGIQDPAGSRGCNGLSSGGFDPVGFILRPIQCALEWAFVPRDTVVKLKLAEVSGAWDESFFGDVGTLLAPFSALPVYTGCSGIPIYIEFAWPDFDGDGWVLDWNFGAACDGDLAGVANTVRIVAGLGLILGGIRTLTWYIGGVIGYRGFGKGDGVA